MKRGKIDTDSIPITETVNITIPIQVVIKDGEFSVMELWIEGEPVPHFRGFANTLLERQRKADAQKQKTPTDW
ncbi:hypothetical protein CGK40_20045 [Vibrio parahaemolyticus]|nr:hypothetical protein CGK40_20045 [Vibrio parahaemolyticus]